MRIAHFMIAYYGCRESAQLVHPPQCCHPPPLRRTAGALVGAGRSTAAASCRTPNAGAQFVRSTRRRRAALAESTAAP